MMSWMPSDAVQRNFGAITGSIARCTGGAAVSTPPSDPVASAIWPSTFGQISGTTAAS